MVYDLSPCSIHEAGADVNSIVVFWCAFPSRRRVRRGVTLKPNQSGARNLECGIRAFAIALCVAVLVPGRPPAAGAVRRSRADRATGETYHVEIGGYLWPASPTSSSRANRSASSAVTSTSSRTWASKKTPSHSSRSCSGPASSTSSASSTRQSATTPNPRSAGRSSSTGSDTTSPPG